MGKVKPRLARAFMPVGKERAFDRIGAGEACLIRWDSTRAKCYARLVRVSVPAPPLMLRAQLRSADAPC